MSAQRARPCRPPCNGPAARRLRDPPTETPSVRQYARSQRRHRPSARKMAALRISRDSSSSTGVARFTISISSSALAQARKAADRCGNTFIPFLAGCSRATPQSWQDGTWSNCAGRPGGSGRPIRCHRGGAQPLQEWQRRGQATARRRAADPQHHRRDQAGMPAHGQCCELSATVFGRFRPPRSDGRQSIGADIGLAFVATSVRTITPRHAGMTNSRSYCRMGIDLVVAGFMSGGRHENAGFVRAATPKAGIV